MTEDTTAVAEAPSRGLHLGLWGAQLLLAALFALAGSMKVTRPIAELVQALPYAADLPLWLVRFIGCCELAGALGMILPAATRVWPRLTSLAGLGLLTLMVLAGAFHLLRGEQFALPFNMILGALAGFVAWGRSGPAAITPRG